MFYGTIKNWKLRNGLVDIDEYVDLSNKGMFRLPINFGHIKDWFDCSINNLTSLEGCPKRVGGGFYCYYNQLTTLEGCPKEVGGSFYCYHNRLTTLEGCPSEIGGNFICNNNQLTTLLP